MNGSLGRLDGIPVLIHPALPMHPSPREDARRMVRHGLADVLAWLGEDVGPEPGAATHVMYVADPAGGGGEVLAISWELHDQLKAQGAVRSTYAL